MWENGAFRPVKAGPYRGLAANSGAIGHITGLYWANRGHRPLKWGHRPLKWENLGKLGKLEEFGGFLKNLGPYAYIKSNLFRAAGFFIIGA